MNLFKKPWTLGPLLILVSYGIARVQTKPRLLVATQTASETLAGYATQDWYLLESFDYEKQIIPETLKAALNKPTALPGYGVPLGGNYDAITEFLLVPNELACIHVPPPPPHLIVHVRLASPASMKQIRGPIWVKANLELKATVSEEYGSASYFMQDAIWEPYKD
mgnify:CR=1 FL=1